MRKLNFWQLHLVATVTVVLNGLALADTTNHSGFGGPSPSGTTSATTTAGAPQGQAFAEYERIAATAESWMSFTPESTKATTIDANGVDFKVCLTRSELGDVAKWTRRLKWYREKMQAQCIPSDPSAQALAAVMDHCIAAAPPEEGILHRSFNNAKEVSVNGQARCEVTAPMWEIYSCRRHISEYFVWKRQAIGKQRQEDVSKYRVDWEMLEKSAKLFDLFKPENTWFANRTVQATEGMTKVEALGTDAMSKLKSTDLANYCLIEDPNLVTAAPVVASTGKWKPRKPKVQGEYIEKPVEKPQIIAQQPLPPKQSYTEPLPYGKDYLLKPNYDPTQYQRRDYDRGIGDYLGGMNYPDRGRGYVKGQNNSAPVPFIPQQQQFFPPPFAPSSVGVGVGVNRMPPPQPYPQPIPGFIPPPPAPMPLPVTPVGITASVSEGPRGTRVDVGVTTPAGTTTIGLDLGMLGLWNNNNKLCMQKNKVCPKQMAMPIGYPGLIPGRGIPFPGYPGMNPTYPQYPGLVGSIPPGGGQFPYVPPQFPGSPNQQYVPVNRNTGSIPRGGVVGSL